MHTEWLDSVEFLLENRFAPNFIQIRAASYLNAIFIDIFHSRACIFGDCDVRTTYRTYISWKD